MNRARSRERPDSNSQAEEALERLPTRRPGPTRARPPPRGAELPYITLVAVQRYGRSPKLSILWGILAADAARATLTLREPRSGMMLPPNSIVALKGNGCPGHPAGQGFRRASASTGCGPKVGWTQDERRRDPTIKSDRGSHGRHRDLRRVGYESSLDHRKSVEPGSPKKHLRGSATIHPWATGNNRRGFTARLLRVCGEALALRS